MVVGAGNVAEEKIRGLLAHEAEIKVISPSATNGIRAQARAGSLKWEKRRFTASDVKGAFLVVAATSSSRTNSTVFHACQERGILCNAVDDPENCDFYYPAIVRRGALQIAISTQGLSPALASRLRRELETQFGPVWEEWLEELGTKRREVLGTRASMVAKRKLLTGMASAEEFRRFAQRRHSANRSRNIGGKAQATRKSAGRLS